VRHGIADEVGQQLLDSCLVAHHEYVDIDVIAQVSFRGGGSHLHQDFSQRKSQILGLGEHDTHAGTHAATGEVEHIVDQAAHATCGRPEAHAHLNELEMDLPTYQELSRHTNCRQRAAQIVAEDRDEPLAQDGRFLLARKGRFRRLLPIFAVQLQCDQLGEELEHGHRALVGNPRRRRVHGAQVAEVTAVVAQM